MSHDSDSDSDLTKSIFNVFFKFKSLTNANYCDDGICKKVISKDIVPAPFPGKWKQSTRKMFLLVELIKARVYLTILGAGVCAML